ncbi:long-chain fatty acid--CoA ligase [Micromonospora sp. KC207]|uniref:class I adenylate-forming enzyme family protein n=1 Tax=Micromonospora sp. KC207 TaxID=2530377 RepID=UPI0010443C75|nr:AMP-binding protein [Micromonospora sp. KC207]TDC63751.1 long-chain fatty acid--CoA ligase [Micromonospora sp. KC207]
MRPELLARPDAGTGTAAVHELLDAAAARPAALAVRDDDGVWTYAQLREHSLHLACWLAGRGVVTGDRVVARLPNARPLVALLYAASRVGAILVPISPQAGSRSLEAVLADAEPVLMVDALAVTPESAGPVPVCPASLMIEEAASGRPGGFPRAGRLAFILYTSGSTAAPKGVMCSHSAVLFVVDAIVRRLGYTAADRVLCRIPLSFDYGLYQILLCAAVGAELQLTTGTDAALLQRLESWRATVVPIVPTLATGLSLLAGRGRRDTSVRLFTNTGAALLEGQAAALRRAFPGAAIALMYGMTECKRISILEPDADLVIRGSVGRPLDGTTVTVVDEDGRELGPGQPGQFVVRGPHLMDGYWRSPDATAERYRRTPDGDLALFTGDFGTIDKQGHLHLTGRRDAIFKRRDVRVSTIEIESAALDVPGVRLAVALPPDGPRDLTLVVVGEAEPGDVLARLRGWLEPAKVPARCVCLPDLPLTGNGKVDRTRLLDLLEER